MNFLSTKHVVGAIGVAALAVGAGLLACNASPACPLCDLLGSRTADRGTDQRAVAGQLPPKAARNVPPRAIPNKPDKTGENAMPTAASQKQQAGRVEHADTASFGQKVLKSPVPVLVDFYADWCGPCQRLAPTLDAVAKETPGARVVKVNVDHSPELAMRYGVSAIPSLRVFHEGEVVAEHVGLASKGQLQALLRR